jgi:cell wall-associated NlpC family hydrolase
LRALALGRRTYALALALLALVGLSLMATRANASTSRSSGGATAVPLPPPESGGGTAPSVPGPPPTTPLPTAQLSADGRTAVPPAAAPDPVKNAIYAANQITTKPYRYGGGHRTWKDRGYDCSGSVSYALHGGGLLTSPLPSGTFMRWGLAGKGLWITVYTNPGHAYMVIAGLRFDTSGPGESGPRWRRALRSNRGFSVRHPVGY